MWWDLGEAASASLIVLALLPGNRPRGWLGGALTLVFGLMMSVYVFGLDTAAQSGSRWSNKGGAAHTLYIAVVVVAGGLTAVFILLGARRSRGWIARTALLAGGVGSLLLGYTLVLLFDNN